MPTEICPRLRLGLVDDHVLVRKGIKFLLEVSGEMRVVMEAAGSVEAIRLLETCICDVILLDISLGEHAPDGFSFLGELRQLRPGQTVVMLSMHVEDDFVVRAIKSGASGYVVKSASKEELSQAIRQAHAGGLYLHPRVASAVMRKLRHKPAATIEAVDRLTPREVEVLELLVESLSNSQIADKLCISTVTVKSHLRSLYRKLSVSNRTQAVLCGIRRHIIADLQAPQNSFP